MEKKRIVCPDAGCKLGNSAGCVAEAHFGWLLLACFASPVLRGWEDPGLG